MSNINLWVRLVLICLVGVAFASSITFFYRDNLILTLIVVVLSGVILSIGFKPSDILLFIVAVLVGSVGDILSTGAGAWQFTNPTFWNIPLWIPISWGCNFLTIKKLGTTIVDIYQAERTPQP